MRYSVFTKITLMECAEELEILQSIANKLLSLLMLWFAFSEYNFFTLFAVSFFVIAFIPVDCFSKKVLKFCNILKLLWAVSLLIFTALNVKTKMFEYKGGFIVYFIQPLLSGVMFSNCLTTVWIDVFLKFEQN